MKRFLGEWKWTVLIGFLVLGFGFALRIINLTILPVFADEAIYIRWSQIMGNEPTLRFLPLSDGKQPLFMWALMFVVNKFSDPLFTGRFLSVLSGLGSMAGIFTLSYILFKNKTVSLTSSIIYAVSPFSFFFDRMALVDSLLCMFGVWTAVLAVLSAKTLRLDFSMLAGIFLGLSVLTKSPGIFFAGLAPLAFIVSGRKIGDAVKFALLLVPSYLIAFVIYNIQRLGPNFHLLSSRTADYVFPLSHLWTNPKDPFIFHVKEIFSDWFIKMGPWPVLALMILGIWLNLKNHRKEILLLLSWFLFPLLFESMFAKVFTVRYILFALPFAFILAGLAFKNFGKLKWISIISFAVFVAFSLIFDFYLMTNPAKASLPSSERSGYLEEWTAGDGIREISEYIKEIAKTEEVVVGTEGYFGTLPDGLQIYLEGTPNVTAIGVGLDFTEVPKSLVDSYQSGTKTFLVVNNSRIMIKKEDYEKHGLKLISSFKKADRREKGSREYISKGPFETLYLFELIRS